MRRTTGSWLSTIVKLGFRKAPSRLHTKMRRELGDYSRRLEVESLEERRLLTAVTVDVGNDVVDFNPMLVHNVADLKNHKGNDNLISLREAILAANLDANRDDITFASGITSIQLTNSGHEGEIDITSSVTINGAGVAIHAFSGAGESVPSTPVDGNASNDGNGARIFNIGDNSSNIIEVSIQGLTFSGGDLPDGLGGGGAIQSIDESLILQGTTFIHNSARQFLYGSGAIYARLRDGATLEIHDSVLTENYASAGSGGALFVDISQGGDAVISNSIFSKNLANNDGGAIIVACSFDTNVGSFVLRESVIVENIAGFGSVTDEFLPGSSAETTPGFGNFDHSFATGGGFGGGVAVMGAQDGLPDTTQIAFAESFHFERNYVGANIATISGGGFAIVSSADSAIIRDCTFEENHAGVGDALFGRFEPLDDAEFGGGGIFAQIAGGAHAEIINTTLSGNRALSGGGLLLSGDVRVRHSTIALNVAGPFNEEAYTGGGGVQINVFYNSLPQPSPSFDHTIIADNVHDRNGLEPDPEMDGPETENLSPDLGASFLLASISDSRNPFSPSHFGGVGDPREVPPDPFDSISFNHTMVSSLVGPIGAGLLVEAVGSTLFQQNPMLGNLSSENGGPNLPDGHKLKTHSLGFNSPALNRGDEAYTVTNPPTFVSSNGSQPLWYDERGKDADGGFWLRVVGRIDLGAIEVQAKPPSNGEFCDLPGDYNADGKVDAADYTVWRNHFGQNIQLPNEGEGVTPGRVTAEDYGIWKQHFGEMCGGGGSLMDAFTYGEATGDRTVNMDDFDVWSENYGSTVNLEADWSGNGIVDLADLAYWQTYKGLTTLESIDSDFNDDGMVDSLDYGIWEQNYNTNVTAWTLGDADGDGFVDDADEVKIRHEFGMTRADVWPLVRNGSSGMPMEVEGQAPQVTNITIGGPVHADFSFASVDGSGEQLRTVPVGGLDEISVKFSEEVLATHGALVVTNLQTMSNIAADLGQFEYDLATQTATWKFSSALPVGQYLIRLSDSVIDLDQQKLDGEFENPWALADAAGTSDTFPSGDGEAGGEFRFRFTNLAADFNGDNIVDIADYTIWANNQWRDSGALQTQGDADGNGDVNVADNTIRIQQFGTNYVNWPFYEPGMILVTTLVDENGTNPAAMSLREALALATTQAGHDTIVFAPSLFSSGPASMTLSYDGTDAGTVPDQLIVDSSVSIVGPGEDLLSLDGNNLMRLLWVQSDHTVEISGLTVTHGNPGASNGGGIFNSGNLTLDGVTVTDNVAGVSGGGVYNNGTIRVLNSTISENTAANVGGGLMSHANSELGVVIENSAIIDNEAVTGGGLYLHVFTVGSGGRSARITNSTISGNSATTDGGGVVVVGGTALTVVQSTITDNHAKTGGVTGKGGGLYVINSLATLHNSIVADNAAESTYAEDFWTNWGLVGTSSYNLIGSNGNSGLVNSTYGNIVGLYTAPISPGLTALGNYGGSTKTHGLLSTSQAIDHGKNAIAIDSNGDPLVQDQRGFGRDVDVSSSGPDGGTIDIGAIEYAAPIIVSTLVDESDGNYSEGDLSLREATMLALSLQSDDTIDFEDRLFAAGPASITLAYDGADSGTLPDRLNVNSNMTIRGPGADLLSISGNDLTQVFWVSPSAVATIRDLTVKDGNASTGGGIQVVGSLTLERVAVETSFATAGGGIYSAGTLHVRDSLVVGNDASFSGGGIYIGGGTATVIGSTISTNGGSNLGGISIEGGTLDLAQSTLTLNGVGLYASSSAVVTVNNTIIAENISNDIAGTLATGSTHNLIGDGGSGGLSNGTNGNIVLGASVSAGLTALGYHGGPTKTHGLLSTSLAIDAGDNAIAATYDLELDQRGFDRVVDWDLDLDARVDIGAMELAMDEIYS